MEQTGRRKERDRHDTGKLGRKVQLTGRNRQEEAGDKQATGRRHETGKIRKKGAIDRQE
jgi:hypothetical protein